VKEDLIMKNRSLIRAAGLLAAFGLVATASAFEIGRTRTAVAILQLATGARVVRLNLAAELSNNRIPDVTRQRVEVGWQQVGGVDPEPFRILIPAGCFVGARGFRVEDFRRCGVQIVFGRSGALFITDFEARLVARDDGTYRLDMEASVIPPDPIHAVLGAVGGAAVQIAIGTESARSLPVSAATVSGVEPQPF
jgi:hypothetical protein